MQRRHVQPLIDALAGIERPALVLLGSQQIGETQIDPVLAQDVMEIARRCRDLMHTLIIARQEFKNEKEGVS